MGVVLFLFKNYWAFGTYTNTYNESVLDMALAKMSKLFRS